jgi:hypothetical protein
MPFGESGEAAPSLIPYQVMSSDSVPASPGHPVVACPLLVNVPCDVMPWRGAIGACTCVFFRGFYAKWWMDCFWRFHSLASAIGVLGSLLWYFTQGITWGELIFPCNLFHQFELYLVCNGFSLMPLITSMWLWRSSRFAACIQVSWSLGLAC